jgi:hypothetical protein
VTDDEAHRREWRSNVLVVALAAAFLIGATVWTGCREKGPVEKAGEKVDAAVDKMKDAVNPKGPAERAGEKVDRALDH